MNLQSVALAYNGGFQNIMHHILEVLKLKFAIFDLLFQLHCFGLCLFACIGLDYYTIDNTFNDIIINNITKLYNITCACFFTQNYIFQTSPPFYF
jgi:hypothetical protein